MAKIAHIYGNGPSRILYNDYKHKDKLEPKFDYKYKEKVEPKFDYKYTTKEEMENKNKEYFN